MRIPRIRTEYIPKLLRAFTAKTVAVIGASRNPAKIGHQVVVRLLESGFEGKIFPVNPHAEYIDFEVRGKKVRLKCYKSIKDVPESVDLCVICVPAQLCKQVVQEICESGKVNCIAMITAGFRETGDPQAARLEDEIVEMCRKAGIPLIGPNIVGLISAPNKMNASFAFSLPYPGKIAFISQSGALIIGLIGWTWEHKIGMSQIISVGNKADVDFSELILALKDDPNTNCIALYIEGIDAGPEFIDACRQVAPHKPIIAVKAGMSERGFVAAMSHTGSMAGSAQIYRAAFRKAGVIMVDTLEALFDCALALSLMPPMRGDNAVVITNGGGAGVLATDAAETYGIPLKDAPKDLQEKIREFVPWFASTKNPIDMTGMATDEWYYRATKLALEHPDVHGVAVLYCHTAITTPQEVAEALYRAWEESKKDKPLVACFIGGAECEKAATWLKEHGIPCYPEPYRAMRALGALREYGRILERLAK